MLSQESDFMSANIADITNAGDHISRDFAVVVFKVAKIKRIKKVARDNRGVVIAK